MIVIIITTIIYWASTVCKALKTYHYLSQQSCTREILLRGYAHLHLRLWKVVTWPRLHRTQIRSVLSDFSESYCLFFENVFWAPTNNKCLEHIWLHNLTLPWSILFPWLFRLQWNWFYGILEGWSLKKMERPLAVPRDLLFLLCKENRTFQGFFENL